MELPRIALESLTLGNYAVLRGDIYDRFRVGRGEAIDQFGRTGRYVPRGVIVYLDLERDVVLKVFGSDYAADGEGCFLEEALNAGAYDGLCPALLGVICDTDDRLRGYAMRRGEALGRAEFSRISRASFADTLVRNTERSGFYFYDFTAENVVKHGNEYSLIDLESVLPHDWFGRDAAFAEENLQVMDVGFPMQEKWFSPWWYFNHMKKLTGRHDVGKLRYLARAWRAKLRHQIRMGRAGNGG